MKKSLIATGAASLALAAMPVLGAFADVTDTVTVTIGSSCSVGGTTSTSGSGVNLSETMTNNSTKIWDANGEATGGGKLVVSCNDAGGWNIKAVGSGADATNKHYMNAAGSGTDIATGTATSGATSNWAFKLSGTGVVSGYSDFAAVPSTATKVASSGAAGSDVTIFTGYRVFVSATQQADTYEGKVTYTVAKGA